jgi:hypothetical protein
MSIKIEFLTILFGLMFLPLTFASAQDCNPAVVDYIVRDESGKILSVEELKSIHQLLPKRIGDEDTAVDEVLFTDDGITYYWSESSSGKKGKKVPVLEFANARTCTLTLPQVELEYHGKKMTLIFNIHIERRQDDRRPVIDSLPFQEGTYVLDLSGWSRIRDQMIPASMWKKVNVQKN